MMAFFGHIQAISVLIRRQYIIISIDPLTVRTSGSAFREACSGGRAGVLAALLSYTGNPASLGTSRISVARQCWIVRLAMALSTASVNWPSASQPPTNSDEGIAPGRGDDSVLRFGCILALSKAEGNETNGCIGLHGRSTFACRSNRARLCGLRPLADLVQSVVASLACLEVQLAQGSKKNLDADEMMTASCCSTSRYPLMDGVGVPQEPP
jgi:hypothetical protein